MRVPADGRQPARRQSMTDPAYPLIRRHGLDAIVAFRKGQPISAARFLSDVAALASSLPSRRNVLNLCSDRYRFAVGLAAALCREQISLLPPNDTPGLLKELAADYPDLYCLTDDAAPIALIPFLTIVFSNGVKGRLLGS